MFFDLSDDNIYINFNKLKDSSINLFIYGNISIKRNGEENMDNSLINDNDDDIIKVTKTKSDLTSRSNIKNKILENDNNIIIHNLKNTKRKMQKRKSAKFIAIQPNEDSKVVNVMRRASKSGSLILNLNKIKEE